MRHLKNKKNLIFFVITVISSFSGIEALPIIPETESELLETIENGTADYDLYSSIRPYYSNPVSVPEGELFILQNFFPELFKNIPSEISAFEKYVPWNQYKIKQFFYDYPQLVVLKPLLSFVYKSKRFAKVDLSSRGHLKKQQYTHSGQVLIQPFKKFSTNLRMEFTDSSFDLVHRTVSVQITPLLKVRLGNFNIGSDQRLFFGFFPVDSIPDSASIIEKIFFSSERNWNGVSISSANLFISDFTSISSEVTFHKRFSETISTYTFYLDRKPFKFNVGISYLKLPVSPKLNYYGQFGTLVRLGKISLESNIGIDFKNFTIPVIVESNIAQSNNSFCIKLMFLPEGFQPPGSKWLRIYSKDGAPLPDYNMLLSFDSKHNIKRWFNLSTSFEALQTGDILRSVNYSIGCNGNVGKIDYVLDVSNKRYAKSVSDTAVLTIQSYIYYTIIDPIVLSSTIKVNRISEDQYQVQTYSGFSISPIVPLKIESSIQLKFNQTGISDVACVLNQTLSLFERTNAFVQVRVPLTKKKYGGADVQAKMSFVF